MRNITNFCTIFLCILLLLTPNLYGGSTGKITGRVTDAGTGEALVGATVVVVNTMLGSPTDVEGKFTIIGVPIGVHSVRVSMVGYQEVIIKEVKVSADQTTQLSVSLSSTAVQMPTVVITADKLVNPNITSSVQTVSSQTIEQIPNVKSVQDVVALQAGVVKMGGQMFLRGGRANEVQYVVDGIPVNNVVGNTGELTATTTINEQLSNLYSGVQQGVIGGGSTGLAVSANAIQTVSVQTSGFDADYGNSQSGIVNIVTKSGGDRYSGSAQFRTDKISSANQEEMYSSFNFGGPEPITKYLLPQLGASIPGSITFFLSTDVNRSDGPYRYVHNEFYNPMKRKIQLEGFLGGIMNGLGFSFYDNQRNSFTLNSKLKYDISGDDQLSYGYRASLGSGHSYYRDWKYRADSSAIYATLSTQHVFSWTHFFSQNTFSRLYLGRVENNETNDVTGLTPDKYSAAWTGRDINKDKFVDLGTGQRWYKSKTLVWTARFDFNSQVHPLHLLKTGAEFNYEEIKSTEIQYPNVPITKLGSPIYPPFPTSGPDSVRPPDRGLYPGYGIYRWTMDNYPNRGALYVQDNIEFEGLNLHVGIRYDYLDLGNQIFDQSFIKAWKKANEFYTPKWAEMDTLRNSDGTPKYDDKGNVLGEYKNRVWGSRFLWYFTHGYFSPRLSIGYPVTDRIVFYFNYGHFLQYPDRDNYFRDPFITGADGNWIGNPDLKPQRTVQYEAGFENQITDDMAFAIRAFYKDIFDYATLYKLKNDRNYLYVNLDFASARGFEITVNRAFSGNFSANVTYTYSIAKGRASNPLASVFNPQIQLPRETRLDWDQQHTANLFIRYNVGKNEEGTFGVSFLNNWGASLKWSYGSGFPYTPYKGRETERNVYLVNNAEKPYNSRVGLSIYKGFDLSRLLNTPINILVTFDVENLLNRRNVNDINTVTGKPNQYGDYDPEGKEIYPWYINEYRTDPTIFEAGRQFFLGLKINWD